MTRKRMHDYKEACKNVPNVKCTNEHQREMFTNAYFAACDWIGGIENITYDYPEDSAEYREAKDYLTKHDRIVADIYREVFCAIYGSGSVIGLNDEMYMKHLRFAGKEWSMAAIEAIVKQQGY